MTALASSIPNRAGGTPLPGCLGLVPKQLYPAGNPRVIKITRSDTSSLRDDFSPQQARPPGRCIRAREFIPSLSPSP